MITTLLKNYLKNFSQFSVEVKVLAITTFINRIGAMVVPFLSKYMMEQLHFTYGQIGWVMVFFGVGSFIGTWISGKLSDKIGFYKVMVFSLFTSGLIFILLQFLTTFYSFCFGVLLLTTVSDMYRPAMLVSLDTYATKNERTKALSLIRSSVNLGFMFGPLIGGIIITVLDYTFLFYIDGLTCILSILLFAIYVKEKKLPFKLNSFKYLKEGNSILQDKPFLIHLVVTLITGILFFQMFTTLSLYYKEVFNFTSVESGLFLALNGVLILLFELSIVSYVESKNINKLLMVSYGVLAMAVSYLFLLIEHSIFALIAMMVFMTIGIMLTFPFANSFVKNRSLKKREGKFMAAFTMSYSVAHILSTKTGMTIVTDYGYKVNWVFLTCLGFVGFLLAYRLVFIVTKESETIKKKIVNSLFTTTAK
ncbi:MFS transporter [Flavobacterium pectinovorum]|uniref:MFS transporter n=1 Tax=Flavobacterium pectinovorum TaxID=29533 RepID=A0AB36P2K2_9FLAO|nr:MFS transporter [Flavobacterium pectinovorum]OXB04516.1 MFS transporter [Flavobacterium pectinovorum]SHL61645.1 Predicted arabinose efflux permease, MFS family [Flavobacterium pectinovorum]